MHRCRERSACEMPGRFGNCSARALESNGRRLCFCGREHGGRGRRRLPRVVGSGGASCAIAPGGGCGKRTGARRGAFRGWECAFASSRGAARSRPRSRTWWALLATPCGRRGAGTGREAASVRRGEACVRRAAGVSAVDPAATASPVPVLAVVFRVRQGRRRPGWPAGGRRGSAGASPPVSAAVSRRH